MACLECTYRLLHLLLVLLESMPCTDIKTMAMACQWCSVLVPSVKSIPGLSQSIVFYFCWVLLAAAVYTCAGAM